MKNLVFLPVIIITAFMVSCKPSVKEAIAYNESIVSHHEAIDKKIAYLIDTYDNYIPKEMDSAYAFAMKAAQDGINFADSLKPFHNDDSYRIAALGLYKLYKSVIETEHSQMIALLKLPPEKYQQKQIDEFDQLKDAAEKKIVAKIDEVSKVQEEFAKKYNFKIENPDEAESKPE